MATGLAPHRMETISVSAAPRASIALKAGADLSASLYHEDAGAPGGRGRARARWHNRLMKIGLIGLPKSGKTTLFNLLTGSSVPTSRYDGGRAELHTGVARVPDARVHARAQQQEFHPAGASRRKRERGDSPHG